MSGKMISLTGEPVSYTHLRQSKIAGVFCKAYEKAVLLTPTEENVRIWVKCTRMTREEMEDTIKAVSYTHLLPAPLPLGRTSAGSVPPPA